MRLCQPALSNRTLHTIIWSPHNYHVEQPSDYLDSHNVASDKVIFVHSNPIEPAPDDEYNDGTYCMAKFIALTGSPYRTVVSAATASESHHGVLGKHDSPTSQSASYPDGHWGEREMGREKD